jgi:hypothetical protein
MCFALAAYLLDDAGARIRAALAFASASQSNHARRAKTASRERERAPSALPLKPAPAEHLGARTGVTQAEADVVVPLARGLVKALVAASVLRAESGEAERKEVKDEGRVRTRAWRGLLRLVAHY